MKRHVQDLLPAHLNGTLESGEWERVTDHLAHCEACTLALEEWTLIASATRSAFSTESVDSVGDLHRVWSLVDEHPDTPPNARRVWNHIAPKYEEKNEMSAHTLTPPRYPGERRPASYAWFSAGLVALLLVVGSVAWYASQPGGSGPEPLPARQLAGGVTPAPSSCAPDQSPGLPDVAGTPATGSTSVIDLTEGQYEGWGFLRPEGLPKDGVPVDASTQEGIQATVNSLTSCMNAGDASAIWALTSADYMRRFAATGREPSEVNARAIVPMVGPATGETPVPEIQNAMVFADGRVGAEIRPGFDNPSNSFDYYMFVLQDGQWLIDAAVHVQEFVQILLIVDDSGFSSSKVMVPPMAAELVLTNEGATSHSFVSSDLGLRVEVAPGETSTISLKASPGQYTFTSDIPGDDGDGFRGEIFFEGSLSDPDATPEVSGQDNGSRAPGPALASVTVHVQAPESYAPDRIAVLADRDVEMTLVNERELEANFTIDALGISVDIAPGETTTIVVNAPEGVYAFYSDIPGHAEVGMSGVLFVKDAPATP